MSGQQRVLSAAIFALSTQLSLAAGTPAQNAPLPDDFALADLYGQTHSWNDVKENKAVVLIFLSTECPLAKLYAPRLVKLAAEYGPRGVAFVGVSSSTTDNITELRNFARIHGIEFTIVKDLKQQLADALEVKRVPTVIVLNPEKDVVYRGRIDDQYGLREGQGGLLVSYQLAKPKRKDLAVALDEFLAGKPVSNFATEPNGCLIGRDKEPASSSDVTYTGQIAKILNDRCVLCHREGQIGPFTLTSYEDASGWAEMILEVVEQRRMPPWHADPKFGHFKNEARLPKEDVETIRRWVAAGAPEGDKSAKPPLPEFADGWMIPEPDQVIKMKDTPYTVKAEGVVPYLMFTVDPGWKEDKWVTAMEPKPGNPKVVHHIVMYVMPPRGKPKYFTKGLPITMLDWFASFAPGLRPPVLPDHMGRYIPAGSKLVFQMHYTPCGMEEEDLSYVGIKFADPKKVRREVAVQHAGNMQFVIPAHAKNYELESKYEFKKDSLLLTVSPHMHLRGKDFKYTLIYPDGKEEIILSVPQYDFGWQTTYTLAEPKFVPKGSKLHCVAHYDNSAENLNNPDPTKNVRFGEQTWDEMMYGWFEICLTEDIDPTKPAETPPAKGGASARLQRPSAGI